MALVTTTEMFKKAYAGGYAIGAFNINNMEIVQAITEAAAEAKSPVILQVSAGARKYAKHEYLMALAKAAIADSGVDLALHLDHGADFEICKACIDGGFTSVMIDGSHHTFEDNIAVTKKVVEYAHAHGVVVEGELGRLAGVEDDVKVSAEDSSYTRPEEVEEFVTKTGVDSLAQATAHTSSSPSSARETQTAYSFPRRSALIFSKRLQSGCPDSRSFFTAHPPFRRNTSARSTRSAESFRTRSVSRRKSSVRLQNLQYARSTSTPTSVLQ